MFVDQADIEVIAGNGGNGCISFRREKYIPQGGPDGGDGGRGGSVFLEAVHGIDTLLDMIGRHHWKAQRGEHGMGKKKAGADGSDLIIRVPPGTLVYDKDSGLLIADLKENGKRVMIAKGGRGGRGNINFTTSVRQAPDFAEPGREGQVRTIRLELRLIADVGLVGLPNAGKSTLLSRLSAARPKIADYPFTTLVPQLGIAELDPERRLVIADIPGLIEGASEGSGLGLDFLRHVERTRVIVHLIDISPIDNSDPVTSYHQIRRELEAYSPKLAAKAEILVANKMDLSGASEALADLRTALPGKQIYAISAVAGTGLRPLLETIYQQVQKAPPSEPIIHEPAALLAPEPHPEDFTAREEDAATQAAHDGVSEGGHSSDEPEAIGDTKAEIKAKRGAKSKIKRAKDTDKTAAEPTAESLRPRKTAAARKVTSLRHKKSLTTPAPAPTPKTTAKAKAKNAALDPELAAEIEAMKADDLRKGKFYNRKRDI